MGLPGYQGGALIRILRNLFKGGRRLPIKSGKEYFSPEAMAQATGGAFQKGHYTEMNPEIFLKLVGGEISPEKLRRVKKLIEDGIPLESYPFLNYKKGC